MPENLYDNHEFNEKYAQMERSVIGLEAAGEWPQLKELLGDMKDKDFRLFVHSCGSKMASSHTAARA